MPNQKVWQNRYVLRDIDPHFIEVLRPGILTCKPAGPNETIPAATEVFLDPFDYNGGVAHYPYDANFSLDEWRILINALTGTQYDLTTNKEDLIHGGRLGVVVTDIEIETGEGFDRGGQ